MPCWKRKISASEFLISDEEASLGRTDRREGQGIEIRVEVGISYLYIEGMKVILYHSCTQMRYSYIYSLKFGKQEHLITLEVDDAYTQVIQVREVLAKKTRVLKRPVWNQDLHMKWNLRKGWSDDNKRVETIERLW